MGRYRCCPNARLVTSANTRIADHRRPDPTSTDPYVIGPGVLIAGRPGGPLSGRKFAVKDLYEVAGTKRGDGNPDRLAESPRATTSAPTVQALLDAGADLTGKSVTDELAFSLSGTNVHYGTPPNPAVPGAVPGGSSSGSVSLVASGDVDLALGTDTGGSTRVPASYCGVFGLRTTHGRISNEGVMLLAPSFCSVGLFAADPDQLAAGWMAVRDGASTRPGPLTGRAPRSFVIAPELFALAEPDTSTALLIAAYAFADACGLPAHEESLVSPDARDDLRDTFRTIQMYEAWKVHGGWVKTHPGSLGRGIAARFATSSTVSYEDVAAARDRRRAVQVLVARSLSGGRYLIQPAASGPAPSIDLTGPAKDELRVRTLALTAVAGLAGAPVVSMPVARVAGGPVGLALVGLPDDDDVVVELAQRAKAIAQ
ncbi:MAG: Amidase [Acidimicrobiaceae bacterium]|nr:Amidase [Acidimicrobiaceae bacterium]